MNWMGRIGSGCLHPILAFACHIHPALDSRLRGNDGLMWERGHTPALLVVGVLPMPSFA